MFGQTAYRPQQSYAAVPLEEQLEALGRAVEAGKVRQVGLSNETPWGVMECCRLGQPPRTPIPSPYCAGTVPTLLESLLWSLTMESSFRG